MIGKWNPSVILTYLGTSVAILGIWFVWQRNMNLAFVCLIWAGVLDLLDGPVARSIQRTDEEKRFGILLDTVSDVVSFLVFPVVICLGLGMSAPAYVPIYALYVICGLARLSDFTSEQNDQPVRYYRGLPVTYAALIFPFVYLAHRFMPLYIHGILYFISFILVGILFILPIKVHKPRTFGIACFGILAIVLSVWYLWF